ncbi:MAG: RNA polymerase sigma-54 factor [Candidatus Anoxychlamydiales bacterium]|nr:RNA polymerase sigma-54 factor [Candidatus Anoxychlamydiales bacterium]
MAYFRIYFKNFEVMDKEICTNLNIEMKNKLVLSLLLQKSLKILELPTLELKEYIQKEIEENPIIDLFYPKKHRNINFLSSFEKKLSIYDLLLNQAGLIFKDKIDLLISKNIIGNLDENGFFNESINEIAKTLNVTKRKIATVLKIIKTFDPIGIAAKDLKESLLIQIQDPQKIEYKIIENHFDDLLNNRIKTIEKNLKIKKSELKKIISILFKKYSFSPRKDCFSNLEQINQIYPDIIIKKENKNWVVEINDDEIAYIKINKKYKNLKNLSKNYIKNAKHLQKSIINRRKTLLGLSFYIIKNQMEFLKNNKNLKALNLENVAKDLNLHRSTVSRAIKNKYILTPNGFFLLKAFFPKPFVKDENILKNDVLFLLKSIIETEDKSKPFSDLELLKKIKEKGFSLSRRTINKYRKELYISSSYKRKI